MVDGITDYLESYNIKVFGPNKIASKLEGSKIFTKEICKNTIFLQQILEFLKNKIECKDFLDKSNHPIVIKADNLAAGKGVYICENKDQSNEQ